MANGFKRTDRVAGLIQRKLAQIIQQEVKDPRLPQFITVSNVEVTADLSYAKIYFTTLDEDKKTPAAILNSAARYIRTALARTLKVRKIPELDFIYDESIEYGKRLSRLIDEVSPPDEENND